MKTIVLDDDPTGTQSASGVPVLLRFDADLITAALRHDDAVYVLTNSRAIPQKEAVELVGRVREAGLEAGRRLGETVRFVLRGDSTLRGHVFAEVDAFTTADSVVLFLPAFPAGGRTTRAGVHYVRLGDLDVPAGDTEFAQDPVFGFLSSTMSEYVVEVGGGRPAITVPLAELRASDGGAVAQALAEAAPGTVVVPDAVTDDDIELVYQALEKAWPAGRHIVVRCAAPLAARCAGALSPGLLPVPLDRPAGPVLLVCGSHTVGATRQLATVQRDWRVPVAVIDTDQALTDPAAAGQAVVEPIREQLHSRGVALVTSERVRAAHNNTLRHGEQVMTALTAAVAELAGDAAVVVAKGGITSAEVALTGLGTGAARVRGQVLPGISVWDLDTPTGQVPYVVVPGNVGDDQTLSEVLRRVGARGSATLST
jgi:uncharacterized protein YgbK (DUF1537 family)